MPDVHVTNCQFSPPMIRALRAGDKTQTRRLPSAKWTKLYDRYEAGDRCYMYVQERHYAQPVAGYFQGHLIRYYASDEGLANATWRPPMHMRREWSRMTLTVKHARKHHLQDMILAEVLAEGVLPITEFPFMEYEDACAEFINLWDSLHTKPGTRWDDDPLVYAFTFRVVGCNIDTYLKEKGLAS